MTQAIEAVAADAAGAVSAPPATRPLTRRQKAAIVVRLLLAEGATLKLDQLPEAQQAELVRLLGSMRPVDRVTLAGVVREFADELDGLGLAFPAGLSRALEELGPALSPSAAASLRAESGLGGADDPWPRILALPPERLTPLVARESVEVAAVILSRLPVPAAAALLGTLPGDTARRIAYAMSLTSAVAPDTVARIGAALAAELDATPEPAFPGDPAARVGAILNVAQSATRTEMLGALEDDDADFAAQVRRAIFTFDDIPARLEPRDVPRVIRGVEQPVLVTALAAGDGGAASEFILANISQRMAGTLRDEITERGRVPEAEGEAAQTALVAEIRRMEEAGELTLLPPEEPAA